MFSPSNDSDTSEHTPSTPRATPADTQVYLDDKEEEEEDFQMVPLDDKHWTTKEVPDRTLCIHEHALPHRLCPVSLCELLNSFLHYSMDLSNISDFEDMMITSSNQDIPALEDMLY